MAWPEISWQYIAGIFDGEGCVDCREYRQGKYQNVARQWRMKIYQNDRFVLDLIQEFLADQGVVATVEVHERPDRIAKGHAGSFCLVTNGLMNSLRFMLHIEPFCIVKHDEIWDAFARVDELADLYLEGKMPTQGGAATLYPAAGSFLVGALTEGSWRNSRG